jgi:thiol:disulfide interchange protein DsbD
MKQTISRYYFLVLLSGFIIAPVLSTAQSASSTEKVKTKIKLSQNVIPAGDSAAVAVVMKVDEGWHVNANEPSQDYLIGTALNIDTLSGITVSGMQYPDSERFTFAFAGEPPDVYQGKAPIFVTLKTAPDLKPGSYTLPGTLRVQACDDKSCMAPSTLDIAIPVEVVAAETRFKSINQDLFSDYTGTYAEKILKRMPK